MPSLRLAAVYACLLTAAACSSEPTSPTKLPREAGVPEVTTGAWNAARPTSIDLRFENPSSTSYYFNACHRELDRLDRGMWVAVRETARVCPAHEDLLNAGQNIVTDTDLPAGLVPGSYRFKFRLVVLVSQSEQLSLTSNAFAIPE
jgi:hypothetical protein